MEGRGQWRKLPKWSVHCKKSLAIFPSPEWMSLTKLSLAGNNLIFPDQGEFGKWHPGWGRENGYPFFTVPIWHQLMLNWERGRVFGGKSVIVVRWHRRIQFTLCVRLSLKTSQSHHVKWYKYAHITYYFSEVLFEGTVNSKTVKINISDIFSDIVTYTSKC